MGTILKVQWAKGRDLKIEKRKIEKERAENFCRNREMSLLLHKANEKKKNLSEHTRQR